MKKYSKRNKKIFDKISKKIKTKVKKDKAVKTKVITKINNSDENIIAKKNKDIDENKNLISTKTTQMIFKAPKDFRLIENPEETYEYFNKIGNKIRMVSLLKDGMNRELNIRLDINDIEKISMETIVYLLAFIRGVRLNSIHKINFTGNLPKNKECKKIIDESGFYNHVNSSEDISVKEEKFHIKIGEDSSPELAKEIVDFSKERGIKSEKLLYRTLMEIIDNTVNHGNLKSNLLKGDECYTYVEDKGDSLYYIIFDTGSGLVNTIKKNFLEYMQLKKIFTKNPESNLIKSTLEGEFRTRTKLPYRGKGMPKIYEAAKNNVTKKMMIISGKGSCIICRKGVIIPKECGNNLIGTFYAWEMSKGV